MSPPRFRSFLARVARTGAGLALVLAALAGGSRAHAFVWPNVPEQIERGLAATDVSERRLAARRLVELPAEIAAPLVQKSIGDPDVDVRLAVAQAAIAIRLPRAGDLVITWLSEGDARLRLAACDVVRASPTDRSVAALGRVLGDPDPTVRLAAAAAMGASALADAVSPLLGHLDDPSPEVRAEVALALGRIGDARAVVPLVGKVQDTVSDVRRAVARALGDLGDARATSALSITLQDASQEVRVEAVTALGRLRSDAATLAIAALLEATSDDAATPGLAAATTPSSAGADEVRAAALAALGRIGSDAAVRLLVASLAKDDPAAERSAVRDALVAAGAPSVKALIATLSGAPSASLAAGAALSLGALRATEAQPAIVRAMERGILPLRYGLRSLGAVGSETALPAVLERLEDDDPLVRREAIRAATALLDPGRPDGRAVDPASAALRDVATPPDEKVALVQMLGRTGTPRAHAVLLPLASTKSLAMRLAVLDALGALGVPAPAVDAALLGALGDDDPDVRLRAATALARVGSAVAAATLLDRLGTAAEQDRGAIGIALQGALARSRDAALAAKVGAALATAPDVARDALIEGLGRMPGPASGAVLARLASGSIDDRRKVAEALAGHPESTSSLRKLATDPDPSVRANAVWSLGGVGDAAAVAVLAPIAGDPDIAVAGNAVAAIARIALREADPALAEAHLCKALSDARTYVRANALVGLSLAGGRCEGDPARAIVLRDVAAPARVAAASYLHRASANDADRRALEQCAREDRDGAVAARCARPLDVPLETEGVGVFVVPDGRARPMERAPFALERADGLLRLGIADRRGALFEIAAPKGALRLAVPAPLVK